MRFRNVVACFTLLGALPLLHIYGANRGRLSLEQFLDWENVSTPLYRANRLPEKEDQMMDQLKKTKSASNQSGDPEGSPGPHATDGLIHASRAASDFEISNLDNKQWDRAQIVPIEKYWSGAEAPQGRHSSAQLLWTERALYVRFISNQTEPPVVSASPKTNEKTLGLWDRDVCEIFIGTRPNEPERYFEFEAAPTGEWIDLGIRQLPDHRETDWDFKSGMTAAGRIENDRTIIAMRIPWKAIGASPRQGARFRSNLYRCVGSGKNRGYLTWRPTHSPEPNFHVPAAFGMLELL